MRSVATQDTRPRGRCKSLLRFGAFDVVGEPETREAFLLGLIHHLQDRAVTRARIGLDDLSCESMMRLLGKALEFVVRVRDINGLRTDLNIVLLVYQHHDLRFL